MTPATRAEIGDLSPSGRSLIIPMSTRTRHRVLGFAVDNDLPERVLVPSPSAPSKAQYTAEEAAIGIILDRYFRMIDSEYFGQFFDEAR